MTATATLYGSNATVDLIAARSGTFFGRRLLATTDGTFDGQAMSAGASYHIAGGGATLRDGGPATSVLLSSVGAVAVSPSGSLLVADGADNRLRAISP